MRRPRQGRRCSTGQNQPEEPCSASSPQLQRLSFSEQEALTSARREDKGQSLSLQASPTDMSVTDFSLQSMASIITEDCFYDLSHAKASTLTEESLHLS